jgi:hypothetical protein
MKYDINISINKKIPKDKDLMLNDINDIKDTDLKEKYLKGLVEPLDQEPHLKGNDPISENNLSKRKSLDEELLEFQKFKQFKALQKAPIVKKINRITSEELTTDETNSEVLTTNKLSKNSKDNPKDKNESLYVSFYN